MKKSRVIWRSGIYYTRGVVVWHYPYPLDMPNRTCIAWVEL